MIYKQQGLHRKQQKQIDLLTQMVPRQQFHYRGRDIHPGRGRRLRQSQYVTTVRKRVIRNLIVQSFQQPQGRFFLKDPKAQPSQ